MYKVQIDISDWDSEETVTISSANFEKVQILQEFIEFQQANGWAADYEQIVLDEEEIEEEIEEEEFDEDEQTTDLNVAVFVFDSNGKVEQE